MSQIDRYRRLNADGLCAGCEGPVEPDRVAYARAAYPDSIAMGLSCLFCRRCSAEYSEVVKRLETR